MSKSRKSDSGSQRSKHDSGQHHQSGQHSSQQGNRELPNAIQVQRFLGGMDYPADKEAIIKKAEDEGADEHAMQVLQDLPDRDYDSPTAISREIGKMH